MGDILVCKDGALTGKSAFIEEILYDNVMINEHLYLIRANTTAINQKYLFYYLNCNRVYEYIQIMSRKSAQEGLNIETLQSIPVVIPSIEIQEELVAKINHLHSAIDQFHMKIDSWKPTLKAHDHWAEIKVGNILHLNYGIELKKADRIDGEYPVFGSNGRIGYHNDYLLNSPAIIVGRKGSVGEVNWSNKNCTPIDTTFYVVLKDPNKHNFKFIYYVLKSLELTKLRTGMESGGVNRNTIYNLPVKIPSLKEQNEIVKQLGEEESKVEKLQQLITEKKLEIEHILNEYLFEN